MSIYSRLFGRTGWDLVQQLPENRRRDCCLLIVSASMIPALVAKNLLDPTLAILSTLNYTFNATEETQRELSDEATLALLKSWFVPPREPKGLRFLGWAQFHNFSSSLFLIELSSRRAEAPSSLANAPYSNDPMEAETQFLIRLLYRLQVRDANVPSKVKFRGFDKLWAESSVGLLSGIDLALSRQSSDVLFSRAKREFNSLSQKGREYVESLATGVFFPHS